jgi:hypothetical protein
MRRKWGHLFYTDKKSTPPAHRTGLFRPTTALPTPPVGVPASPWVWAKARSKLGTLIRLYGDGAMSNEAKLGSFYTEKAPLLHTEPGCSDRMWAKARSLRVDRRRKKYEGGGVGVVLVYLQQQHTISLRHADCVTQKKVPLTASR